MKTKTKTLTAIAVAAALGGDRPCGCELRRPPRRRPRNGLPRGAARSGCPRWRCSTPSTPTATESSPRPRFDKARNDRHAAHDADGDGNLSLEEFAELWHETTRPLTVRAFQMLDTDGDAVVTRAEYESPACRHRRAVSTATATAASR